MKLFMRTTLCLTACIATLSWTSLVIADEEITDAPTLENEVSTYQNPAQAMHASNLAEAVAAQPNEELESARQEVIDAQNELNEALKSEDEELIEAAKLSLETAETSLAEKVSEVTGAASDQIADLRDSGMGWGQIAHELGVHPSALGLGHAKKQAIKGLMADDQIGSFDELTEATAMDLNTGAARGHGVGNGRSGSEKKGLGLSSGANTKSNAGVGGGKTQSGSGAKKGGSMSKNGPAGKSDNGKSANSNKGGKGSENGKGKGKDK